MDTAVTGVVVAGFEKEELTGIVLIMGLGLGAVVADGMSGISRQSFMLL